MKPVCCNKKESTVELAMAVEFLKVISEENRLKILCMLREKEKCVCDIWQYLDLSQNLVSHHLKALKKLGLISSRQKGLQVFYSLEKKSINKYSELLNRYLNSFKK